MSIFTSRFTPLTSGGEPFSPAFAMSHEETLGLIKGLAAVVRDQNAAIKSRADELTQLASAVKDLSTYVGQSSSTHPSSSLRLPNLTLPEFTGTEDLDRFLEQFTQVLQSSGVPTQHFLTYLKQQCRKDARSFDILCTFDGTTDLPSSPGPADYLKVYEKACQTLQSQRGVPKDQRIQTLLATYYTMHQQADESVAHFAHRFCETQHSLEKLIPGIHKTADGKDLELLHAFALKLRPAISKQLLSRDFTFPDLSTLIEAAKRYELSQTDTQSHVSLFSASTSKRNFVGKPRNYNNQSHSTEICRQFNKYSRPFCQLSSGKCEKGYVHKCSECGKFDCKALKHQSSQAKNSPRSKAVHSHVVDVKHSDENLDSSTLLRSIHRLLSTKEPDGTSTSEATPSPGHSHDHLYSMPALSQLPNRINIENFDLANKNILWCPVSSAGVSLPLPLDTCCSVSLVSKQHADKVLQIRPDLAFSRLEQPVTVSVASPSASLKAIGVLQVPIKFDNGRSAIFSMLVVPHLAWPILFGQNHLKLTDAHIRSRARKVYFADKGLNFEVCCSDTNPIHEYPHLSLPNDRSSSANVTCLLTTAVQGSEPIPLHTGFNFLPVCVFLMAFLIGSPLFSASQPLWLAGSSLMPGVSTLSGPIALSHSSCGDFSPFSAPHLFPALNHSKCRPSRPLQMDGLYTSGVLTPVSESSDGVSDLPPSSKYCFITVVIHSTRTSATLSLNAPLGQISLMSLADHVVFEDAAAITASQVARNWYALHADSQPLPSADTSQVNASPVAHSVPDSRSHDSMPTGHNGSIDSSILAPYLPSTERETPEMFPPGTFPTSMPFSDSYFTQLVASLDLDMSLYSHVPHDILSQFKTSLRKYQHIFHLSASNLSTVMEFSLIIPTGEFLSAVLYRLTKLLSIRHVYTSAFRPRLNGTTERVHRFLNSALGIFCEKQQERWEEFLQSAVYSHNTSPISGITDITPFFLVFGRNAPSPETVSLDLPPLNLSPDHYAYNLVQRMKDAHTLCFSIKSDLRRRQRELYDLTSRDITVPDGKLVYMRKESHSSISGQKPRFLRNFDGPFLVTGHPHDRSDLLHLRHIPSGKDWPHPVNIEKIIVIPDISPSDISPADTIDNADDTLALDRPKQLSIIHPNPDLAEVAYRLGQYLSSIPSKSSIASQACKYIYESYPSSREILAKHGKLRGLVKSCPFLNLEGASHGGVYILSLNSDLFERFRV